MTRIRRSPSTPPLPPTAHIFEVSPCQPSLITVTSMLSRSPDFSFFFVVGMPWQTTWFTEVHTERGKGGISGEG